jgi:uncharacterized membrane protein YoaK (UPF0700 family)
VADERVTPPEAFVRPSGRRFSVLPDGTGLLLLLSAVAGSTDAIGFLGLNGLFTAHITGNIVVLASHLAAYGKAGTAQMIAVPVFMAAAGLARLLGLALDRRTEGASAAALLILQFALLLSFFLLCLPLGKSFDAAAPWALLAGMCGVAAMAVQNVLVQTTLQGAPATAVLTMGVTRFAMAAVETMAGNPTERRASHAKLASSFPPIVGFIIGCAAGGFLEWLFGLPALLLPVFLSLVAVFVGARRIRGVTPTRIS